LYKIIYFNDDKYVSVFVEDRKIIILYTNVTSCVSFNRAVS